MPSPFVRPEIVTLSLSSGDTISVRKRLNAGERSDMMRRARDPITLQRDQIRAMSAAISAYLIDWSFKDSEGKSVEIRDKSPDEIETILKNLDPDVFDEIGNAIDAHYDRVRADLEKEKNVQGGVSASSAISPSLDSSDVRSIAFVN